MQSHLKNVNALTHMLYKLNISNVFYNLLLIDECNQDLFQYKYTIYKYTILLSVYSNISGVHLCPLEYIYIYILHCRLKILKVAKILFFIL